MPVHSSAMSTPSSLCGSSAGSLIAVTLDLLAVDDDDVALDLHLAREAAVDGVEAQQMGVGLDRAEIVDRHHLDVLAAALDDGAQDVAPDAPEAVDRDLHRHSLSSLVRRGSSAFEPQRLCVLRTSSATASAVMPKCL